MPQSDNFKFKRHKLPAEKADPLKDLIDLYAEEADEGIDDGENEKPAEKPKHDLSLKRLIEENRGARRKKFFIFSAIILFCFAAAAVAGFFYFDARKSFDQGSLQLTIAAPEKVKINETFNYVIKYQNAGEIVLLNSRLTVQYPPGFILDKSVPDLNGHELLIGDILALAEREVVLTGKIIDDPIEAQTLSATLSFEPSNFHSTFSKSAN